MSVLPGGESSASQTMFFVAVALALGAFMVAGNTFTVVSVLVFPKLRTLPNMYVVSLATTDALVGLLQVYVAVYYIPTVRTWFDSTEAACTSMLSWGYTTVVCSGLNMCLIAFDRYLYIAKPFFYVRVISKKRIAMVIVAAWFLAVCYGSITMYHNLFQTARICTIHKVVPLVLRSFSSSGLFFLCCCITAVIYAKLAALTLRHKRAIALLTASDSAFNRRPQNSHPFSKSSLRAMKLFFVVFGLLVACWSPYFTVELVSAFCDFPGYELAYKVTLFLGFFNSGINIFVYPYFDKEFRRAYRSLLCRCCDRVNTLRVKSSGPDAVLGMNLQDGQNEEVRPPRVSMLRI
ncbi:hypothetical protein C0Q70_01172 [Pomacea canaliculata]|uniref:G-protein coupled receptors family 1 profile domain-containing protein n=1 Tax=Pomacea canaliculata TaxID=400727 RepID=A0A2T7PYP9_POMCA|nr:probable G-protein coupled receptor No9 [Pomacea canaliculata]PVD38556.1 hypothetical protein C0Q70_01172 [Pomacea canaliculata]